MTTTRRKQKHVRRNWPALQTEYVESNDSLRDIARRHKMQASALGRHSSPEHWVEKRVAFRAGLSDGTVTGVCETRVASEVVIDAVTHRASTRLMSKLEAAVGEEVQQSPGALCQLIKGMNDTYRLLRETAGLPPRKEPSPAPVDEDGVYVIRRRDPNGNIVEREAGSHEGYKEVGAGRPDADADTVAVPEGSDAG